MPAKAKNTPWLLAIATAVLFPALILHATCVAVLGPGTWGSGLVEILPELREPTPSVERYRASIATGAEADSGQEPAAALLAGSRVEGSVTWAQRQGDRELYLTEDRQRTPPRQRLYVGRGGAIRETPVPDGHLIVRPQWAGERVLYERWNPWAIPPARKLGRYVASWADPSLRPEAALYISDGQGGKWTYLMPGHSVTVAPDGRHAALLRSGALLAGYYSIHVWPTDSSEAAAVISLREHDGKASKSFTMRWSEDSEALRVFGRVGGLERRGSRGNPEGAAIDLLYLVAERAVYDLARSD